ncbi:hypothetical protein [Clostridium tetani]|nr:hypothetical protein [Clostridium tetani]
MNNLGGFSSTMLQKIFNLKVVTLWKNRSAKLNIEGILGLTNFKI